MGNKIFIVSGKIQSGKTTRLFEFIRKQKSVDGILAPVVNGKRHLYHISSKRLKLLEVENSQSSAITVGKYIFDENVFKWAREKLSENLLNKAEWIIIDEVGKLELDNKGLEPAISELINSQKTNGCKIILVVRDYLLDEVLKKYKFHETGYERLKL